MSSVHSKVVPPGTNRLARFINNLVNPLTIGPVLIALVAAHAGYAGSSFFRILTASIAGYSLIPLALLLILKRWGAIETIEARDRTRRKRALWVGVGLMVGVALAITLLADQGYDAVVTVSWLVAFNTILAASINERFKISLHVMSVAGLASFLIVIPWVSGTPMPGSPWVIVLSMLLIPLIMWGRLTDEAHSRHEILAGCIVGLVMPGLELWTMDRIWPLF